LRNKHENEKLSLSVSLIHIFKIFSCGYKWLREKSYDLIISRKMIPLSEGHDYFYGLCDVQPLRVSIFKLQITRTYAPRQHPTISENINWSFNIPPTIKCKIYSQILHGRKVIYIGFVKFNFTALG